MIPKFRAWIKSESRMIDSEKIASLDFLKKQIVEEKILANEEGSLGVVEYTYHNLDDVELMQSTGLKDINGVEIYEGDIIVLYDEENDYEPCSYIVRYLQERFEWLFVNEYEDEWYKISSLGWDELEIIGNVYENPELLEGTK